MCAKCIFRHELLGNLSGKARIDSARDIDVGKLPPLELRVIREFPPFPREIGIFDVRLRTDRDIFARRHGHSAGNKPADACQQHVSLRRLSRSHTQNEASGRDDPIICAQHCSAKPSDSTDKMCLAVHAGHRSAPFEGSVSLAARPLQLKIHYETKAYTASKPNRLASS